MTELEEHTLIALLVDIHQLLPNSLLVVFPVNWLRFLYNRAIKEPRQTLDSSFYCIFNSLT